jgi:hypothetical protein
MHQTSDIKWPLDLALALATGRPFGDLAPPSYVPQILKPGRYQIAKYGEWGGERERGPHRGIQQPSTDHHKEIGVRMGKWGI